MDDLKISHVETSVESDIIEDLDSVFKNEAPLTIKRGTIHDYLGMKLDFRSQEKAKILMVDYIQWMIDDFPPVMDGKAATPEPNHLFEVKLRTQSNSTRLLHPSFIIMSLSYFSCAKGQDQTFKLSSHSCAPK